MAIPASGNLSIKNTAGTCRNLCTAVIQGGGVGSGGLRYLTTQTFPVMLNNGSMRQFYGYNPIPPPTLSVSNPFTDIAGGSQLLVNTITASAAWVATISDPDNIINTFASSGSGGGKLTAASSAFMPFFPASAIITYCISGCASVNDQWFLQWDG